MKNLFIFLSMFLLFSLESYTQNELIFEKSDSVLKDKNQIYSATKMFIAEYWKSAQNVIQNDDKDGGVILVKGLIKIYCGSGLTSGLNLLYSYAIKFLIKDNKYKIIIYNITPEMNISTKYSYLSPDICNNCEFPGVFKSNVYRKDWERLQLYFPKEMNTIITNFDKYIKSDSKTNSDW